MLFYIAACKSTSPTNNQSEFALSNQQANQYESDEFDGEDESDEFSEEEISPPLHPKTDSAWSNRRLLSITQQPNPQSIQRCVDIVESKGASATNLEALHDAALDLDDEVRGDKVTYHWCFYQMMADLDKKMDQPLSLMDEKADIFLNKMSRLWILAVALDNAYKSTRYETYLRSRYTSISLGTFGRLLETMNDGSSDNLEYNRGKPAGHFFE
jgi:hypothetical protein